PSRASVEMRPFRSREYFLRALRKFFSYSSQTVIKQLTEPDFLAFRTTDLILKMRQQASTLEQASVPVRQRAEEMGVTAADLLEAISKLEAVPNEERKPKKERDSALWLPRDANLGIVQSALEEFYRKAGAIDDTMPKGFVGELPDVTSVTLKPDWIPTK